MLCAILINQVLFGPLAHLPMDSISTCSKTQCVIYWVEREECETVKLDSRRIPNV
jgi:hypothetical protein